MKSNHKRIYAAVLGACLLAMLSFAGVSAWAVGAKGWIEGTGASTVDVGTGTNSLAVDLASNDEAYSADLAEAQVVVDVYKVGTATKLAAFDDYDYTLDADYDASAYTEMLDAAKQGTGSWDALAEALAANATLHEGGTVVVPAEEAATIEGLADGLYLVLAHGSSTTDGLRAQSGSYAYAFQPIIVALPTKDAVDGVANTANRSDWVTSVALSLKSARSTRYGSLAVTKTVTKAPQEDATFVFHVVGTTPMGQEYDNYLSVTLKAGETSGTNELTHIPAGTEVSVSEIYAGSYQIAPVSTGEKGDVILADDTITFSCVNEPGTSVYGGNGVQNNFAFDKEGNGDWDWTPDPADRATSAGQ